MSELENAAVVDFPLRGEWQAYHTPASKIPSHGTDMLGQRYAFDAVDGLHHDAAEDGMGRGPQA